MPHWARSHAIVCLLLCVASAGAHAQEPITYRVTFPAPEHRWLQVEATFADVPAGPLQIRMSRSSPGRYALHEFAKNVFDVRVRDGKGQTLVAARPSLHGWDVEGHDGTVVVSYRVFGDRVDGTYLAIDTTHAHMNIPATLMFAKGLERRPARVTFVPPAGRQWRVATQLYPTNDPFTFTAPNLSYLMDSPTELSAHTVRSFTVAAPGTGAPPTFRIALHHEGTDAEADAYARDAERIVRETLAVFGDFPQFENGTYTFLADYLPWASGDGMEHRNSTVLSANGALRDPFVRTGLLATVAHEFFHAWNMERIRARAIEPFNFEDANVSGELWFGEGFTSYYDELLMHRAGLQSLEQLLGSFAGTMTTVVQSPARRIRSAEEMSQLAPFTDAAAAVDRTNWPNTFISYYTWGAAIGLGLDLSLRDRSDGKVTLDDYMRALWVRFGKPGQEEPGLVATPYTMADLKATLATVACGPSCGEGGDRAFADEFFARYIQGHDVVDYARLFARAGLSVRRQAPDRAAISASALLNFSGGPGARVAAPVPFASALYNAGVAHDDQVIAIDGVELVSAQALEEVLRRRKPGDAVPIRFVRRSGETVTSKLTLEHDTRLEIVPIEQAGGTLTPEQSTWRQSWLGSKAGR